MSKCDYQGLYFKSEFFQKQLQKMCLILVSKDRVGLYWLYVLLNYSKIISLQLILSPLSFYTNRYQLWQWNGVSLEAIIVSSKKNTAEKKK